MNNPLVLSIDCGTQSMRALLFDREGNLLFKSQVKYDVPYKSSQLGYAEQSGDFYWEHLARATMALKKKAKGRWDDIICVTVSAFRDSYVCLDTQGKPLADILIWADTRQARCEKKLPFISRAAFRLVGMTEAIRVQRKLTKSNWIIENQPKIWAKTYKYMSIGGMLTLNLCGKFVDAVANQVGHVPFDYKTRKWKKTSDIQFPVFNVPLSKLPDLVETGEIIGTVSKQASAFTGIKEGLEIIACGSDKGCETLGVGVISADSASLSFGTASTVQLATHKYVEPLQFMPAYPAVIKNQYNPEIQIFRGYWLVSWFMKEIAENEVKQALDKGLSPESIFDEKLSTIPVGSDGLIAQPFWAPQLKNPEARGSIIGFTSNHTKQHIYRAIIEGVGYALLDGFNNIKRRTGNNVKFLAVSGGGSQSDEICQITADMFNLPVKRVQTYETTGLGCSIIGFVSKGYYSSHEQAVSSMVHYVKEFTPNLDNHTVYDRLYHKIYKKTYKQLRPLFNSLYNINKKNDT